VDSSFKQTDTNKVTEGSLEAGRNAEVLVSYGNGIKTLVESSSNTFDLDGMKVTVSGVFGDVRQEDGSWTSDTSMAVTFSASADVDGVTEAVKKFFEEYNAMVTEVNKQITTRPDSSYGPLTDAQKAEMTETSIENWEKKAKEGLLFNDATMRSLSMDLQSVMTQMLNSGISYQDLEEMGITMSDDYLDGGTITFNEAKFRAAMTSDPDKVSNVFTGGGSVTKGFTNIVEDTLTTYATRYRSENGNSYGRLIEEAGSEKVPLSVMNNQIYRQLKDMEEVLNKYKSQLLTEQDRYIKQFTSMETLINRMNSQSSYLSQLK
jgi:flagellar hook-associated protein 2